MGARIIECAANFSEGRDPTTVDAIANTIAATPGVALLHRTMDWDHHRSVLTFAGQPDSVGKAAVGAVVKAAELIDLTSHSGVHPRLGAADVVPFIPVEGVGLDECVQLARRTGEEIWRAAGVPVYFYEAAAVRPDRKPLEKVRRGGFEAVRDELLLIPDRQPDVGGPGLHPTAGAVIVGARKYLVAFNVNLDTTDLETARAIARRIRTSSGGFPEVKALGLPLASRGQVQVSMNLTDYEKTPVHVVYDAIRREAELLNVRIAGSEIIGLIPRGAIDAAAVAALRVENFQPSLVLENRIREALPLGVHDFLDKVEDRARPGGLAGAIALSGAIAASLGVVAARISGSLTQSLEGHRLFFIERSLGTSDAPDALLAMATRAEALNSELQNLPASAEVRAASQLAAAARNAALDAAGAVPERETGR